MKRHSPYIYVVAALCLMLAHLTAADDPSLSSLEVVAAQSMIHGSSTVIWLDNRSDKVTPSLNVTVRLSQKSFDVDRVIDEKILRLEDVTPVEMKLPMQSDGQLSLHVLLNCSTGAPCPTEQLPVRVLDPIQSIGLRTDKSFYQPQDIVSVWVGALDCHTRMLTDVKIQLVVLDPNNVTVKTWTTLLVWPGLKNLLFELSDRPESGVWTVRAAATVAGVDSTASHHFRVSAEPVDVAAPSDPKGPRTVSLVKQGASFSGELIASTSERGITVLLEVVDHVGRSVHNQTLHFNKTSTVLFTVPAGLDVSDSATLQATLQSIEDQPLDSGFVLANHKVTISPADNSTSCLLQIFTADGRYNFQENDNIHVLIYTGCRLRSGKINYVVTHENGNVVSWGQEYLPEYNASVPVVAVNLSIGAVYDMIPRCVVTAFVDDDNGRIVADGMDISVKHLQEERVHLLAFRSHTMRVNVSLTIGSAHCLYGSWPDDAIVDNVTQLPPLRSNGHVHLLPKSQLPTRLDIFGRAELWFVECFDPSEYTWREMDVDVASVRQYAGSNPELKLLTVDADAKMRTSKPLAVPRPATVPWQIDFQLPASIRIGEELVIDITLKNHLLNCSQTQLQMAISGGGVFVANGKKFVQQPACLPPDSKSIYRVGVHVTELDSLTVTVQLKGTNAVSCCPSRQGDGDIINLDAQPAETLETVPVSRTTVVLPADFSHVHKQNQLFCLEEDSFQSNASSFVYRVLPLSPSAKTVVFQVSATADLHVILSPSQLMDDASYHLVLGGADNSYSWVSTGSNGLSEIKAKVATPKLLRQDRLQTFWISWDKKKLARKKRNKSLSPDFSMYQDTEWLSFGKGSHIGSRTILSLPMEVSDRPFRFIGLATGWGFSGFFRVWGASGTVDESMRSLTIGQPTGSASGQSAEITVRGGIASVFDNLWAGLATDQTGRTLSDVLDAFYRDWLKKSHNNHDDWNRVVQNILRFRSADGWFHDGDGIPDLKLTAMTLHVLSSIMSQSYTDPWLLKSAFLWLHSVQDSDGGFDSLSDARLVTTSFILTCLADVQHDDIVLYQLTSAAQRFLELQLENATNIHVIVPTSAAVLVSHTAQWTTVLEKLDAVYPAVLECYKNDSQGCLSTLTYALMAYFHQNQPEKYLTLVKQLVEAPWHALLLLDKIRSMKMWEKYGQVFNDPVRNLNVRFAFQDENITEIEASPRYHDFNVMCNCPKERVALLKDNYNCL